TGPHPAVDAGDGARPAVLVDPPSPAGRRRRRAPLNRLMPLNRLGPLNGVGAHLVRARLGGDPPAPPLDRTSGSPMDRSGGHPRLRRPQNPGAIVVGTAPVPRPVSHFPRPLLARRGGRPAAPRSRALGEPPLRRYVRGTVRAPSPRIPFKKLSRA